MCVHSRSQTCLPSPSFPPPAFLLCDSGVRPCRQSSGTPQNKRLELSGSQVHTGMSRGPGLRPSGRPVHARPGARSVSGPTPRPAGPRAGPASSRLTAGPRHIPLRQPSRHGPLRHSRIRPLRPRKASQRLPPQPGQDETARPAARLVLEERSMRRRTTGAAAGHVGVCMATPGPRRATGRRTQRRRAPAAAPVRTCPHQVFLLLPVLKGPTSPRPRPSRDPPAPQPASAAFRYSASLAVVFAHCVVTKVRQSVVTRFLSCFKVSLMERLSVDSCELSRPLPCAFP